jgi:hypothetical protein
MKTPACTLEASANDAHIFSRFVTTFTDGAYAYDSISAPSTPISSDVTLKLQISCSPGTESWRSSYIFVDGITMALA